MRAAHAPRPGRWLRRGLIAASAGLAMAGGVATGQEAGSRYQGDIRDLSLALTAETMPDHYFDTACGSNGGPPGRPIDGFTDFMACRPDALGLREVYFTFDDEWAQIAAANPGANLSWVHKFSGTVIAGFPVIASILFDEAGQARIIRMVTDSRAPVEKRSDAYLFRIPIERRFGRDGWTCTDLPALPGETDIGGMFIKRECVKVTETRNIYYRTHFYRKPGQTGFNTQGEFQPGQMESSTWLEIRDPALVIN